MFVLIFGIYKSDGTLIFSCTPFLLSLIALYYVDISLSTLDYALLPKTQVAIHSFDMRLPVELTVEMMHQYPFVKEIKASLTQVPSCRVRVTPLSKNSGLRGVDLGSLPVLNDWIQEALHDALEEYLSPAYIAFDIKSLFDAPDDESVKPTSNDINANIERTIKTMSLEASEEKESLSENIERIIEIMPPEASEEKESPQLYLPSSTSLASEKATCTATIYEPIQLNAIRTTVDVHQQDGSEESKIIPVDATEGEIKMNRGPTALDVIANQMTNTCSNEDDEPSLKEFEAVAAGGKRERHAQIRERWWGKRRQYI